MHICLSIWCTPDIAISLLEQISADAPLLTPVSQMKFLQIDSDIFIEVHKLINYGLLCVIGKLIRIAFIA